MRNKLTILSGLPASGKSTYVAKRRNNGDKFILICFDEIHKMLFGGYSFEDFGIVASVAETIFDEAKQCDHSIIIDNTNLRNFYIRRWEEKVRDFDYEVEVIPFKISIKECLLRNMKRDRGSMNVPQHVILKMANSSDMDWLKKMWEIEREDIMNNYELYGLTVSDIVRYK